MNRNLGLLALTGILTLASCGQGTTPNCDTNQTLVNGVCTTPTSTGMLTISNPNNYTVVVKDASGNTVAPSSYNALAPGNYSVTFSQTGYASQSANAAITAGQTTTVIAPVLSKTPVSTGTAYYIDGKGVAQPIPASALVNAGSNFVFYAWLQNNNPASATNGTTMADMTSGQLSASEVAPIKSQNLAAAYVGYKAADGNTYPVVGAGVRWDIVQDASQTNVRFAAADDGVNAPGATPQSLKPQYVGDQALNANTFTNAASNSANNASFPSSTNYPLYNNAHLLSPNTDGSTWTALWVPNQAAGQADVSVIASINGTEIDKTVLHKTFAPSARLTVTKSVDSTAPVAPGANRTFTITVKNDGQGPATGINLTDALSTGTLANYSLTNVSGNGATTTPNANGGFTSTFDLAAGATQTFTFTATGSASGQYCDTATIGTFTNGAFGTTAFINPTDGSNQACVTVVQPQLNIIKQIANADGTVAANQTPTVSSSTPVYIKVTLLNSGTADATGVNVSDALNGNTTGTPANYSLGTVTASTGASAATVNGSGFTAASQTIPVGGSVSYLVPATATADGKYCDTASFTSTNAGTGSSDACITVATAHLNIVKSNSVASINPGGTYTSTITVNSTGTADATTVDVNDLVGQLNGTSLTGNSGGSYTVTNGAGATTTTGTVNYSGTTFTMNPTPVTIPAGGQLVMNVSTTVPANTTPGLYCDTATYTSGNAGTGNAQACVSINALLPTHIQSGDSVDPLKSDNTTISTITFTSFIERTANENGINNVWNFNYGSTDPSNYNGAAGVFNFKNVHVIYDAAPVVDTTTGIVTSDYTHGTDITSKVTLSAATGTGLLTVTAPDNAFSTNGMAPGSVVYIRTDVTTPVGSANAAGYSSVGRWVTSGSVDRVQKVNQAAENTTVN